MQVCYLVQVCSQPKFKSNLTYENTVNLLLASFVNFIAFINHNNFTVLASSDDGLWPLPVSQQPQYLMITNDQCPLCVSHVIT